MSGSGDAGKSLLLAEMVVFHFIFQYLLYIT